MTGAGDGDKLVSRAGLAFQSDKRPADYERLAAGAENYGFGAVSVYGDLYFQPPVPALLAMARATSAVRLGPACLNPYMMHPVEIAGQIAALDVASGGRAFLGLARGSWLSELGVEQRDAPGAVMETAAIVAALLKGDRAGVTGQHFVLPPGASLRQRPLRASIPLLIGTWGRRLGSMAAELADEVKIGGTANPEMVTLMHKWITEGGTAAQPLKHTVGIVAGAVTVVDEDGRLARAKARREVVMYLDVVGGFDPTFAFPPGLLEQIRHQLLISGADGAARLVPDEVLDRFAFAGTPDTVAQHALQVLDAGAARIDFGTPHGTSDDHGLELLGSRVLPAIREARAGDPSATLN